MHITKDTTDLFAMAMQESETADSNTTVYTEATFKATRLISGHTVETCRKGILDFRIAHRFGFLNQGLYELFGLDNATERMSFDYGITDRLTIGFARSTFKKQLDGTVKFKLLRQSAGKVKMPVTVTVVAAAVAKTLKAPTEALKRTATENTSYVLQFLIARKVTEDLSLQLMPTLVHYNLVPFASDKNDRIALGIGGRQKISKRISIDAEYYYRFDKFDGFHNALGISVDIETGGHVFQLAFTNATGMTEPTFINETTGRWGKGDIHFGFNISRVFKIGKKRSK